MIKKLNSIVFIILFGVYGTINAQEGFRMEADAGVTIGDSRELYSYAVQGSFYFLRPISENIFIGPTAGALVFLGEGKNVNGSNSLFGSIPEIYLPVALAGRVLLSKTISTGLDLGFGLNASGFSNGDGGFYFRPVIACHVKEKLSLTGSLSTIRDSEYIASSINIGINFRF